MLAVSDTDNLSRLASMADKIVSRVPGQRSVASVSAQPDLMAKIAELTIKVDVLSTRSSTPNDSENRSRSRTR